MSLPSLDIHKLELSSHITANAKLAPAKGTSNVSKEHIFPVLWRSHPLVYLSVEEEFTQRECTKNCAVSRADSDKQPHEQLKT